MLRRCWTMLKLALPVMISQVSLIIVIFADNIMVGHYSTQALAASSFVVNTFNVILMGMMGFSYGLTPLIGMLYAQNKSNEAGRTLKAGLWANLLVAIAVSVGLGVFYIYIPKMGQPEELLPLIRPYFLIMLTSLLPIALFNALAQWSYAIRNTAAPMWILLGCNLLNMIGNYILIYGKFGAPELGLTGAGISTLIVRILSAVAIVCMFFFASRYKSYREGFAAATDSLGSLMKKVTKTSWPVALQMTFETSAFSACAIMAGWLGTIALASFQIIVTIGTLGFCIYYSVGTAITILVSNEMGRGAMNKCRQVAFDGYAIMLMLTGLAIFVFLFFARPIMGIISDDPVVIEAAAALIIPLALYQLGDATQVTFANALRGTSNVMPMLWIAFVSYIIVGLPSSWLLAFPLGLGNYGITLSFSVSLFLAGALFLTAFLRSTRAKRGK